MKRERKRLALQAAFEGGGVGETKKEEEARLTRLLEEGGINRVMVGDLLFVTVSRKVFSVFCAVCRRDEEGGKD
jgi:hypothetical protein